MADDDPLAAIRLKAGLRAWAKDVDPRQRAAVELLIADGYWLRHDGFAGPHGAIRHDGNKAWIGWDKARQVACAGMASSSQLAILRLAIAIGTDEYRLSRMDDGQAGNIVAALATALGMEGMLRG